MKKIYLARGKPGLGDVFFIASLLKRSANDSAFFHPRNLNYRAIVVDDVSSADIIMVPQAVTDDGIETGKYLAGVAQLAKQNNKPVALFIGGDLSHGLKFQDFILLRGTQYSKSLNLKVNFLVKCNFSC